MLMKAMKCTVFVAVAALWSCGHALAADPAQTVITVEKMHCKVCAKKLVAKLEKVAGVQKVEADVEAKTLTVTPKAKAVVSPKALWETIEKGDDTPKQLTGPSGTFTSKPGW